MKIETFVLERFFAKHEFSAQYLLSSSDCESLSMSELLNMADAESRGMWKDLRLGYTETPGHPALREAIAELYKGLSPEDVLVVVPEEGIFLLMQALLEPGDHVVCTFPGYQSLYEVARSIGCDVSMWAPDEAQGWRFDVRELPPLLRKNTRLLVVNFPHNPTGSLPDQETYASLVELVRQRGIPLFSDEMYRFLELDPASSLPPACEMDPRFVSLGGLSKSFGLPGLRIGWVATRDRGILDRMSRLKDYTTICSSAPSEILALAALRSRDRILPAQRARVQENLRLLERFFDSHSRCFQWNRPQSGSICFPRVEIVEDTFLFCETLVKETGVMLAPSRMFHYGDRHVRFGFGRDDLREGLERLSGYLDRLAGP
ncbi:MAG: aminotransferase class I/II-fold pyridoxal phosphate-dependent enzyme [Deltaproteobacteria bacterium]|nr:aminotransferase class I/II-fold pyridoxal phosphate-dependent enzyme [Deltaproteobacteria bacterium]